MIRFRFSASLTLAVAAMPLVAGTATARTTTAGSTQPAPRAVTNAAPAIGRIAPRTPGGRSVGATQGDQGRMNSTVGGIDNHLLNQEKDRPRLPGQAPSPSQTLPGGTASGQTPH